MKTMFEYDLVRRLHFREGLSRHEISRRTGLHRKTISKMFLYARPPGYRLRHPRPKTKLGPFLGIIERGQDTKLNSVLPHFIANPLFSLASFWRPAIDRVYYTHTSRLAASQCQSLASCCKESACSHIRGS